MDAQKPPTFGMFGTYRFVLAMVVFVSHLLASEKYYFIGNYAVFAFFTLSGYTVAFILETTYLPMKGGIKKYAINRFLRIYPLYWIVFACSIGLISLYPAQAKWLGAFHYPQNGYEWFCNITLFTTFFSLKLLSVPTSWSLYNECIGWAMMPFILKSTAFRLIIFWLGLAYVMLNLIDHVYWEPTANMRFSVCMILPGSFFPFCAGMYIAKSNILSKLFINRLIAIAAAGLYVILIWAVIASYMEEFLMGCYLALLLNMSIIAYLSGIIPSKQKALVQNIDRLLGNLAYPIYLIDFAVILLTKGLFTNLDIHSAPFWGISVSLLLFLSIALHYMVQRPIDNLRKHVKYAEQRSREIV